MEPLQPAPSLDLLDLRQNDVLGMSAFASNDIPEGGVVLEEAPIFEAALQSRRLAEHVQEIQRHSTVQACSRLFPDKVAVQNFGMLDAFADADEVVRGKVLAMQASVDPSSPIQQSTEKAAEMIASLGIFTDMDAARIQKVLLVGRINAYSVGGDRQALFPRGRFIAHSCRPNCAFVAVRSVGLGDDVSHSGCFRAVRKIECGELLTAPYAAEDFLAASVAQRRHYLLCQTGFLCKCEACVGGDDVFNKLPCPRCRAREEACILADDHLTGCCAVRSATRSPPWIADCAQTFTDEEMRIGEDAATLLRDVFVQVQLGAAVDKKARNAFLAKVLKRFGEDHFSSQALLRAGALRAVAELNSLPSITERLLRCHDFLTKAGWPLGIMPICGLYRAIVARAQAEVQAKSAMPTGWPRLVADAARCAAVVEGADSNNAKRASLCARLCEKAAAAIHD